MGTRRRTPATLDDGFLPLNELATYSGMSRRFLEEKLTDPHSPLPHYRVGTKIVVKRSEYDAWMEHYRVAGEPVDFKAMVDEKLGR